MLVRKNDSGRSIVEMLGVLAIMGVITVMGISGYSQAIGKINRNNAVEGVTKIAQEVRGIFAGRTSYNEKDDSTSSGYDISTNLLAKMGIKLSTPYGSLYEVKSVGTSGNKPGFYVTIPNVPYDDCLYLGNMAWSDVMDSNISAPSSSAYTGSGDSGAATSESIAGCNESGQSLVTLYFK